MKQSLPVIDDLELMLREPGPWDTGLQAAALTVLILYAHLQNTEIIEILSIFLKIIMIDIIFSSVANPFHLNPDPFDLNPDPFQFQGIVDPYR